MSYRVRVFDQRIVGMFAPGGETYRESSAAAREIKIIAEIKAPKRTGGLARKHRITNTGLQPLYTVVDVRNDASYALFVHEGTTGPIGPTSRNVLKMRPAPHSYFPVPTFHVEVAGQDAQPWLEEAAEQVRLRRYGH